ncbi:MAG TPA: hypothetical protein VF881_18330 [Polyangiaceae bacterium]
MIGNGSAELGDGLVERRESSEPELGVRAGLAPVGVDLIARAVTRSIGNPGFGLARGERDRDERRAQVVDADGTTFIVIDEELGPRQPGFL